MRKNNYVGRLDAKKDEDTHLDDNYSDSSAESYLHSDKINPKIVASKSHKESANISTTFANDNEIESALFIAIRRRLPIASKYMQDLFREKTVILFFSLLFFIVLSVSLLLLTLSFIYNPDTLVTQPLAIGVVGSSPALSTLVSHPKVTLYRYDNLEDAREDFDTSAISAIFSPHMIDGTTVIDIILPPSPVTSAVVLSLAKNAFETSEMNLQQQRLRNSDFVWSSQIRSEFASLRGSDVLFEIILGLIIPLFVLIPAFVIGNLFVDTLTQEFEQKLHHLLFIAISPLRFVMEYLLFGVVINTVIVFLFVGVLFLRFSFVSHFFLVMLYAIVFSVFLFLFALACGFYLRKKEVAQTVYSFGIVALFLLSPFFSLSPLFTLTEVLLGNTLLYPTSISLLLACCMILAFALYRKLKDEYYLS